MNFCDFYSHIAPMEYLNPSTQIVYSVANVAMATQQCTYIISPYTQSQNTETYTRYTITSPTQTGEHESPGSLDQHLSLMSSTDKHVKLQNPLVEPIMFLCTIESYNTVSLSK